MNTRLKLKLNRTTATIRATLTLVALGAVQAGHAQNLFVDNEGSEIFEFTPGGSMTTFATGLYYPGGLAFNSSGNLFVADAGSGNIYEFTPGGTKTTFATGLLEPNGLAFNSSGNLFASDSDSTYASIYEYAPNGSMTTFTTGLFYPQGLAFNSSGNLFEADSSENIYEFTPGGTRTTFATGFVDPYALAFQPASAPEASTVFDMLGGLALGGAGLFIRRRKR